MKKEILSQDELVRRVEMLFNSEGSFFIMEDIYNSHAAALERIATLEKIADNLSVQIDRRDMDWHSERKGLTERIAELEKQLSFESDIARESISCRDKQIAELETKLNSAQIHLVSKNERIAELEAREKQLEDGWHNAEERCQDKINECISLRTKIADLESRLAEYEDETEQVDTIDDAGKKCSEWQAKMICNGHVVSAYMKRDMFIASTPTERAEFPYAESREPKPVDLVYFKGGDFVFQVDKVDNAFNHDKEEVSYLQQQCKPTGYRVNKNGDIVKIKRGDK